MLLSKKVKINITIRNITYFKELGYNTILNSELTVKVKDLKLSSRVLVNCLCDYCLAEGKETIVPKQYVKYIRDNVNGIIHKDTCKSCQGKKLKESNLKTIGKETNLTSNADLKRLNGIDVYNMFIEKKLIPLFKPEDYNHNTQALPFICPNHKEIGTQYKTYITLIHETFNCRQCYIDYNQGSNSYTWKGGITPLHNYLRDYIVSWKKDSTKQCNYKCIITGEKFKVIHHLYGFNLILQEIINKLNLNSYTNTSNISDFPENILQEAKVLCIKLHSKYGLGVCLHEEIHKLFHKLYGTRNNTPEQFEEFKTRLRLGEFNYFLEENKLKLTFI